MGWSTQYFTTIIIEGSSPNVGIFIYSPTPGTGNLVGSWAAQGGTDSFGNTYPTGINVTQGQLLGVLLQNCTINSSTLLNAILQTPQISTPSISLGTIVETTITFDSSGGSLLAYTSATTTVTQTVSNNYSIVFPAGVSSAKVECWGADAGGGGGSPAKGGEAAGAGGYSAEPAYPVIPGNTYFYIVGLGGTGGITNNAGTDGGDSSFDGSGVYAFGGSAGGGFIGGQGGPVNPQNTVSHSGGNGGGNGNQGTGGCGAGGRAGSTGNGGNGSTSVGAAGANGGTAGTGNGSHAGGNGGNAAANGVAPGGGAGAGNAVSSFSKQYHGSHGNSYYGSDGGSPNAIRIKDGSLYQGGETASGGSFNGTQKSMVLWPFSTIASDLAGATIDSITVRLNNLHSWFNSGLSVALGFTNNSSLPTTYNGASTSLGTFSMGENTHKTFSLPKSYGTALQGGTAKTLVIGPGAGSFNLNYYGYFYGIGGSNSNNPMLTINYHTGAGSTVAGDGTDGQVTITYTSGNVLQASLSPTTFTDVFGNTIPVGLGQLQPSGQYSKVSGASTDLTNFTVTQITSTQISKLWPIPANDAKAGTIYRLTVWGNGTQGSTAENIQSNLFANGSGGTNLDNTNQSIGTGTVAINAGFHWRYQAEVIVATTGVGGTVVISGFFTVSTAVGTTTANASTAALSDTAKAFNTTVANTLGLFINWNSATGAPTITSAGSLFERLGP